MVRRWHQLPLDHALSCAPTVRRLVDDLAGASGPVPDLGPAVLMDQLTVLVYDTCTADWTPATHADLADRLGDLRRDLA